jgi:broad specificity phosphatase PhoE
MIRKVVYFVRHGESIANISPVFQSPDSPLSERGCEQAKAIAERASKISFEAFIASPLERTRETADYIAKVVNKEPEYSELFVERAKPKSLNGKPHSDKEAHMLWKEWTESLYVSGVRVADGENFDDLVLRADRALAFLKATPERSILVVTHGYFLRTIMARVLLGDFLTGEAHRRFQRGASMENTGLSVLRYEGTSEENMRWRLWVYNDHAHLG